MARSLSAALPVTRRVLRVLIRLNILLGAAILALLVASLVAEEFVMSALGVKPLAGNEGFTAGMRAIMVIGILSVPVAHIVLTRLGAIVETVRIGDPFISLNAERLRTMAWAVLTLEVLHLTVGLVAAGVSTNEQPLDIDWNFSVTRWLAVLLLFVLSSVFEHGARMREDLEGTV